MEHQNKYGPRYNIHTTLNKTTFLFFEKFKKEHNCNLNAAIEHMVAHYISSNEETKEKLLNEVVDKIIERYYHEHIENKNGKTKQ